jgi:hypothetical protein
MYVEGLRKAYLNFKEFIKYICDQLDIDESFLNIQELPH